MMISLLLFSFLLCTTCRLSYLLGPWNPMAYIVLISLFGILFYTYSDAMESLTQSSQTLSFQSFNESDLYWLQCYRLIVGIYCLLLIIVTICVTGPMPLVSYTVTSWNLMTSRLLSSYLATRYPSELFAKMSHFIRYPALVGCTITVVVWWLILVPIIHAHTEGKKRTGFWKFNFSPLLLNLHFLNLPIVAIEFLWSNHSLHFIDLWMGLVVAFVYVMFYLLILDPAGLHFYIILSPRTVFCIIPYLIILSLYFGLYHFWNKVLLDYRY